MDDELIRHCERWLEADEAGRDEEADAAFKKAFAAVPQSGASAQFSTRTLQAVTTALAKDVRHARRARVAVAAGASVAVLAGLYFGGGLIVSALSSAMMAGLDLLVSVVVSGATALNRGASVWTVLFGLGRAGATFLADPKVTMTLLAVQGIAVAALFALQRLLGADAESFK